VDQFVVLSEVLFLCFIFSPLGVDYNVIHVDRSVPCGHSWLEDRVRHHLEGRRGVGKSEEHYSWFE